MLNQVILVGRLVRTPELQITDSGRKRSLITLAVNRSYKNQDGEYDTDFLDCTLWTGIAENTAEYCKSGDIIGVKGRIQTWLLENDDGSKYKKVEIIAEKVTFLSSSKNSNNQNEVEEDVVDDCHYDDNMIAEEIDNKISKSEKKKSSKKKS